MEGRVVTASDLAIALKLGLFGLAPSDSFIGPAEIEQFIDAQSIVAEASRLGIRPSAGEVEAGYWEIDGRQGGAAAGAWLDASGIDREWARDLVSLHLVWRRFIDLRFGTFVFVSEAEVLNALGRAPASAKELEDKREALRSEEVGVRLAEWLKEAHAQIAVRRSTDAAKGVPYPFGPMTGPGPRQSRLDQDEKSL